MSYNQKFFEYLAPGAEESAEKIVPVFYELLNPKSVLDVGCGLGSWLKVWQKKGVEICGVDGSWVDLNKLEISKEHFQHINLEEPFDLDRRFDLVVTLEVAEHLHKESAEKFVQSLTKHANLVLFSAAVPWQGGEDHFNEQWPSYWIELFKKEGYVFLDPFRHLIWNETEVKYHYRQNTILFAKEDKVSGNLFLENELEYAKRSLISVVHPEKFISVRDPKHRSLKQELPEFLMLIKNFVMKLFK